MHSPKQEARCGSVGFDAGEGWASLMSSLELDPMGHWGLTQ